MCGIAGMLGLEADPQVTEAMLSTMARRGPDGSGIYRKEDCCLLHSRLAVIDPAKGNRYLSDYETVKDIHIFRRSGSS